MEGEEGSPRYERAKFLEGATIGIGALIGAVVTLPVLGFTVLPAFVEQDFPDVDLGPLDKYPEGEWRIATFVSRPEDGNVSRRTAFVRYNGLKDEVPSFTDHLEPVRAPRLPDPAPGAARGAGGGPDVEGAGDADADAALGLRVPVPRRRLRHEGNRVAGPPVRSLDRYEYSIIDGSLFLGAPYSVGEVTGQGADAVVVRYRWTDPGVHVDGPEEYLYPYSP